MSRCIKAQKHQGANAVHVRGGLWCHIWWPADVPQMLRARLRFLTKSPSLPFSVLFVYGCKCCSTTGDSNVRSKVKGRGTEDERGAIRRKWVAFCRKTSSESIPWVHHPPLDLWQQSFGPFSTSCGTAQILEDMECLQATQAKGDDTPALQQVDHCDSLLWSCLKWFKFASILFFTGKVNDLIWNKNT